MSHIAGLLAIDWAALEHSQGSAADLPQLFTTLAAGPERDIDLAFVDLYDRLIADGLVFSATAPAVPILTQLALQPSQPERARVLELIGHITRATAFPEIDHPLRPRDEVRDAQELSPHVVWALTAKAQVSRQEASWAALLDDLDGRVRGAAAYVLSGLDQLSPRSLVALASMAASEEEQVARAAMLLAIVDADVPDATSHLLVALKHGVGVVKNAAAVALGRSGFPAAVDVAVDTLVAIIRDPYDADLAWGEVPGADDIASDARDALVTLAPDQARLAVGPLLSALGIAGCDIYQALRAILELTFPESGRAVEANQMTPVQKGVLERITATQQVWSDAGDRFVVQRYFRLRGLPGTRAELRWFLASAG